ncbi:MAG TPA: 4Fe-4S binding protein [Bacteroidetes bacterium]|nr:4Fe-4S binding protein [Bacteroidota bacterium]
MMKYKFLIAVFILSVVSSISFGQTDKSTEFEENTEQVIKKDEFDNNTDEFDNDEFGDSAEDEFGNNTKDEFSEFSDEDDVISEPVHKTNWNRFNWAIGILFATFLAGIFVRHEKTRKLRPLFLLAAVVILGFYRGGPGIISSFQNVVLISLGQYWKWTAAVLFIGVIILTYFHGKVFCGWICYLGAIQEFLYISKIKVLQTEKAQKIMRIIRYILLALILVQLVITQSIEWSKIGPFKIIFNLYSPNLTGYILLGILLISSLFIYRPFCKMVCPAGLIFGWVTKLPGASVLGITNSCTGCKICNTSCSINAITRENKISKLDNQECIMCGECMNDCRIKSIKPFRKNEIHKGQITLKGIKKLNIK